MAVGVSETPAAAFRSAGRLALLREVVRRPSGLFGAVVGVLLFVAAIVPSLFAPYSADRQDIPSRLQGPSWDHLLGTDEIGRDLLSRMLYSTRIALGVAIPSVLGALSSASSLASSPGYRGGMLDNVLIVVMDSLQAFPAVILALVLLALLGSSLQNVIIVITVAFIPNYARVSRALVLALEEQPVRRGGAFARRQHAAARRNSTSSRTSSRRSSSCSPWTSRAPSRSRRASRSSGIGVQPPTASWGVMLADGFVRVEDSPWGVIAPGMALMLTTLGVHPARRDAARRLRSSVVGRAPLEAP